MDRTAYATARIDGVSLFPGQGIHCSEGDQRYTLADIPEMFLLTFQNVVVFDNPDA